MKRTNLLVLATVLCAGWLFAGCGAGKKPLAGKAEELMNLPTTEKLDPAAKIKGKVAVVESYPTIPASLESFKADGSPDISSFFFPPQKKAQSPEEIETLIKVVCRQGKVISGTTHASECDVSAIDYKTKTVFAKKSFVNDKMPAEVPASGTVASPSAEMKSYVSGLTS